MRTVLFFLIFVSAGFSEYTINAGKLVPKETVATQSVQEHYSAILQAHENQNWEDLIVETRIVIENFEKTHFAKEATYFLGVAYYNKEDYENANKQFTTYLTTQSTPKYFEEAIQYKFNIADKFRFGAKKHLMGIQSLPKWSSGNSDALSIYNEVISALPNHELAAQSLYGKAHILIKNGDYRAVVESFQTLIRRFPKHPLAVESYIGIGEVYLMQSKAEYPDPDFLDLAELNLRKFRTSFPGEEKIAKAEKNLGRMQDHYANSLYDTARFYERTSKWGAAKIYYLKILKTYPHAEIAVDCPKRLKDVEVKLAKVEEKKANAKKK